MFLTVLGLGAAGAVLVFFGLRGLRFRMSWAGAEVLQARVTDVRYEWKEKEGFLEDEGSRAVVTMEAEGPEGRLTLTRRFCGITDSPAPVGRRVRVFCQQPAGRWALAGQVRRRWALQLYWGGLSLLTAFSFLLAGRPLLAALSDFTLAAPTAGGSYLFALAFAAAAPAAVACIRYVLGAAGAPVLGPLCWAARRALGRLEPVPARCGGLIRRQVTDETVEYRPLFTVLAPDGPFDWHSRSGCRRGDYHPGQLCTLYRSRRTGALLRAPSCGDWLTALESLPALLLALTFAAGLALLACGLLVCALACWC